MIRIGTTLIWVVCEHPPTALCAQTPPCPPFIRGGKERPLRRIAADAEALIKAMTDDFTALRP
jgi:hypothetical protein